MLHIDLAEYSTRSVCIYVLHVMITTVQLRQTMLKIPLTSCTLQLSITFNITTTTVIIIIRPITTTIITILA